MIYYAGIINDEDLGLISVHPSEVSVIVQGPVMGKSDESYDRMLTRQSLDSIRHYLPGAEIIFSTWENSDLTGLTFDTLVENEDPGSVYYDDEQKIRNNANRQVVTTLNGLKKATRRYSVKLRSDMALTGTGFLDHFDRYQHYDEDWKLLNKRVLGLRMGAVKPQEHPCPFHPGDWFYFGLSEDVLNIWDSPLAPEPESTRWFEHRPRPEPDVYPGALYRFTPEQQIWIGFLKKYKPIQVNHLTDLSGSNIEETERYFANNLVFLEHDVLGVESLKHASRVPPNWEIKFYTYIEWLKLYEKYCL